MLDGRSRRLRADDEVLRRAPGDGLQLLIDDVQDLRQAKRLPEADERSRAELAEGARIAAEEDERQLLVACHVLAEGRSALPGKDRIENDEVDPALVDLPPRLGR